MGSKNVIKFNFVTTLSKEAHINSQHTLLSGDENANNGDELFFDGSKLIIDADSFSQVTGFSREGVILFKDVLELVSSPDWQSFLLRRLKEAFRKGESVNVDFWFSHQSGDIRLAKLFGRGSVGHDSGQGFKLYLIERPHPCNEVVLEETPINRYYRLLNFPDYLFIVSLPDTTILFVNNSYAQFYNTTAENLLGKKWIDFLPDEKSKRYLEMFHSFTPSCPTAKIETYVYDKKGNKRWYEWSLHASYNKSGTLKEYSAVGYEVTHYRELNDELAISKARYEAIVENQRELIVRHLVDGEILFINEAFCRFFGARQEDLLGLIWFDLIDKDTVKVIKEKMARITLLDPTDKIEMQNKRIDGKLRWMSWNSTGIFNANGELTEFLVVGRDINERKEMEVQLLKMNAELTALKSRLELENKYLIEKVTSKMQIEGVVADSSRMHDVFKKVMRVAETDAPVLIMGETGTGKELIAHAIHNASKRNRRAMITVNCAALPSSLIESELFGREKGAYTGALSKQIGRFELAHNSTIFLDEIGDLPLDIQVKLLRVLQFGEFQLLGNPETRKTDVRVIAATNKNLEKEVSEGRFRQDLYYRLSVFPITIPPLRERKEDIPPLVFHFIDEIGLKMGKRIEKVNTACMNKMLRYDWPGNVRELRNIIEYSMILCKGTSLEINFHGQEAELMTTSTSLENQQREYITRVLEQTGWRIRGAGGAAEVLGLKESTLRFRMKRLGITRNGSQ